MFSSQIFWWRPDHFSQIVRPNRFIIFSNSLASIEIIVALLHSLAFFLGGITTFASLSAMIWGYCLVPFLESVRVNHQVAMNRWHYWSWVEPSVFTMYQHRYQYEVYAIVDDIQMGVCYVCIHLQLRISILCYLWADVSLIE